MKASISYLGYKITPHNWVDTETQYGQYDIFICERKINRTGFKVTKGKKEIGKALSLSSAKAVVNKHIKMTSPKYKARIKELQQKEKQLRKEAIRREKSPVAKVRNTADSFYHRSRIAGHKAFNLEMGRSENW